MRISKLATMAGIILGVVATGANAAGTITLSKNGSQVDSSAPGVYYLGTATNGVNGGAVYDGTNGTTAPTFATSNFSGDDQLQFGFTAGTHLTNFGADGPVLVWNGTKFVTASGVFADGQMMDGSPTNQITTNDPSKAAVLGASGPTVGFGPGIGNPLGGVSSVFQLFLESDVVDNTYVSPADDGIYLVLMQANLVGGSPSLPFGLLVGFGDTITPDDIVPAQNFADEFITPEPASLALLAIGGVLMLRRGRRQA